MLMLAQCNALKDKIKNVLEKQRTFISYLGRGERARTFDLAVPNRARSQLRHTPKCCVHT